ncbi:MAG: DUF4249 family protein [Saprospiraceae bacterium]|nr:DUF4249 family protein [Saprospiraceae bacterium]
MNRRTPPILLLLALLFVQCAREVFIDLPEEPTRIVVISHFSPGQPFKVRVSLSQPLYDLRDPIVPDKADVTVAQEGVFLDKLFRVRDDFGNVFWESRDLAETGVPYSVAVRVSGYPNADAAGFIPVFSALKPIQIDPASITETPLNDGRLLMTFPLRLQVENLPAGKRYFAFYLRHDIEVNDGTGITTYEGISTNYSADGRTLSLLHDLEAEPLVLINEKFWSDNRDSLVINARIAYNPAEHEKPRRLYVEWRTLSEDFYKYHLSLDRQGSNLPLSDPDAVYNNVSGGYGNFSGYSVRVDMLELP